MKVPRSTDWLTKGVIKQHRTLATYINMLVGLGFLITMVAEWVRPQRRSRHSRAWAARISSAVLVHRNGLGAAFVTAM